MKKYQVLFPVLLPLALLGSFAYMIQGRLQTREQYNACLAQAAHYYKNGVTEEAVSSYQKALEIFPSIEVCLKIGRIYLEQQQYQKAERLYSDQMVKQYPREARTYEYGIQTALAQNNPRKAYRVYDTGKKRGLQSEQMDAQMQPYRYSFNLAGAYDEVRGFSTSGRMAAVRIGDAWGYLKPNGQLAIQNLYRSAGMMGELAPVVDGEGEAFFVDGTGARKITEAYVLEKDPEFGQVQQFGAVQEGLIPAWNGTVWNYYDAQSFEKQFGGYRAVTQAADGVCAVSVDGENWALATVEGKQLTEFVYHQILLNDQENPGCGGIAVAEKDGLFWLLDTATGQPINQQGYEDACAFNSAQSLAAVKCSGQWMFVDAAGELTDLGVFQQAKSFSAGLAPAKKDGKWGYINSQGEWAIEPQFEDANAFDASGAAFVKTEEGKWRLLTLDRFFH